MLAELTRTFGFATQPIVTYESCLETGQTCSNDTDGCCSGLECVSGAGTMTCASSGYVEKYIQDDDTHILKCNQTGQSCT